MQLGVLLQPVLQALQLRDLGIQLFARIGGHAEQRLVRIRRHAGHGTHRIGKRALAEIRKPPHAVPVLVQRAENAHPCRQNRIWNHLRRGAQPAAAVQQHHQHAKGSRNGKRQQKQPGIFTVQVTAGKANARCQQPRPNGCLLAGIKHSPQRRPRHTGKKQQAERREDIIPVNAQRVRRPAGRQKCQQRVQQQGQGPGLARRAFAPQRAQSKRRQPRCSTPQQCPAQQVGQVQFVEQCQPDGKKHAFGKR